MSILNNRFINDTTFDDINRKLFKRLIDSDKDYERYIEVKKALSDIYSEIPNYIGHNEANPEVEFVPLLEKSLGMSFYPKPHVKSIGKVPDFSASSTDKKTYMNLYLRAKDRFWNQTDFILEVKPLGFDLEGNDKTTGMSWIEKCGWLCSESGAKFGILTNFQKWYIIRSSEENEIKYISIYPETSGELTSLHLVEDDPNLVIPEIDFMSKILTLLTSCKKTEFNKEFLDVDNEELDIADKLLPRFLDSISILLQSSKKNNDVEMQLRLSSVYLFSLWSSLSETELISSDKGLDRAIASDLIKNVKSMIESGVENLSDDIKSNFSTALENTNDIFNQVLKNMPKETADLFELDFIPKPTINDFMTIISILFLDFSSGKVKIRGSHKLGAASISTIFEGVLTHEIKKDNVKFSYIEDYWNKSLGEIPNILMNCVSSYELVPYNNETKRKKLGAYFTPTAVCNYLINRLDFLSVGSSYPKAFDPTCGTGQFILAFLRVLSLEGIANLDVNKLQKSIYGNDIEPVALFITSYRINSFFLRVYNHKVKARSLGLYSYNFTEEKGVNYLRKKIKNINFIIGNPPFGANTNMCKNYSNSWQSCLNNSISFSKNLSYGIVLPVSICNSSTVSKIRSNIMSSATELAYVAFDTRPMPIFKDVDQRVVFINGNNFNQDIESSKPTIISGGFRRHKSTLTINQSIQNASWIEIDAQRITDIFPLPNDQEEYQFYLGLKEKNLKLSVGKVKAKAKAKDKGKFEISVLAYGRYNINAVLGSPPTNAGKKWKTFHFTEEIDASLMVLFLNSHIGWNIFRMVTNGLDFNNRVVQLGSNIDVPTKSKSKVINEAKSFTKLMKDEYNKKGEFRLSGKFTIFSNINKLVVKYFKKELLTKVAASDCSDTARIRVLKGAKVA